MGGGSNQIPEQNHIKTKVGSEEVAICLTETLQGWNRKKDGLKEEWSKKDRDADKKTVEPAKLYSKKGKVQEM